MSDISRIEIFCDDRVVGKIQRLLAGAGGVYEVKATPVVNGKAGPNGMEAKSPGKLLDLFAAWLKTTKKKELAAQDFRDFQSSIGRSPSGYSNVVARAVTARLIRKVKSKGSFKYIVREA